MSLETIVGTATVVSSLAGRFVGYPAQIRLILKTRMVSNLSVTLHSIGFVSCLLWTWHGWLQRDWVILLTQGMAGIAATGSMLFLIWRFHPRRVAGEHLMRVLMTIAMLDNELHAGERREIEQFAHKWQLKLDWTLGIHADGTAALAAALADLRAYLATRPAVAQMREFKDMVWVLAEADGQVTGEERELVVAIQQQIEVALKPFGEADSTPYCVVVTQATHAAVHAPAFEAHTVSEQTIWVSVAPLTQAIASQFAAELRAQQVLAFAVPQSDVDGLAQISALKPSDPLVGSLYASQHEDSYRA